VSWLVGAILGGIVGLMAQVVVIAVSRRYKEATRRVFRRVFLRWEREDGQIKPRLASAFPEFFKEAGAETLDIAIYELSLRPTVPIIDLLYFEYLKARIARGAITQALVVPWSGSNSTEELRQRERQLRDNLTRVFGFSLVSRITIVGSSELRDLSSDLLEDQFLSSLEALGDSVFLAQCSRAMGHRFRSYHDINKGHPETLQARSLVEHSMRGWLIYRYLERTALATRPTGRLSVGTLLWENEMSKLLLLRNIQMARPEIKVGLMLGKSVRFRSGLRQLPIPTYQGTSALGVFASRDELMRRVSVKTDAELAVTAEVLRAISDANGWNLDLALSAARVADVSDALRQQQVSRHAGMVMARLTNLRHMYGIKEEAGTGEARLL